MTEQLFDVDMGLEYHEMELALEEHECEHGQHNNPDYSYYHEGPGTWYAHWSCVRCADEDVELVCDKWAQYILSENMVGCTVCGKAMRCMEGYKSVVKR